MSDNSASTDAQSPPPSLPPPSGWAELWPHKYLNDTSKQNAKLLQSIPLSIDGVDDPDKMLHVAYKCNVDSSGETLYPGVTHFLDLTMYGAGNIGFVPRGKPYMAFMRVLISRAHPDHPNTTTFRIEPSTLNFATRVAQFGERWYDSDKYKTAERTHDRNVRRMLALTEFFANFPVILNGWGAEKRATTSTSDESSNGDEPNQKTRTLFRLLGAPRAAIIGKHTETKLEQLRAAQDYCGSLLGHWEMAYDWLTSVVLATFDEETVRKREANEAADKRVVVPEDDSRAAAGALSQAVANDDDGDCVEQSLVLSEKGKKRDANAQQCCVM